MADKKPATIVEPKLLHASFQGATQTVKPVMTGFLYCLCFDIWNMPFNRVSSLDCYLYFTLKKLLNTVFI